MLTAILEYGRPGRTNDPRDARLASRAGRTRPSEACPVAGSGIVHGLRAASSRRTIFASWPVELRALRGAGLGRRRALARGRAACSGPSCRGRADARRTGIARRSPTGSRPSSRASRTTSPTSSSTLDDETEFDGDCARRCAAFRAARSSPTASWRRSPAGPAQHARPARSAPATALAPFLPCHRVVARTGSARYGSLGARVQAAAAGARRRGGCACLSEELRDELAAIAPAPRCCRLAELSALFHSAGSLHLRGARRARRAPRPRELRPPRRRAFSLLRELRRPLGDPHLPPARVRPGDALPAARRRRRPRARSCCARPASRPARRAARAAAEARRRPLLLPRRLPPRRAARRRLAVRPARRRTSSSGRPSSRARASSPRSPRARASSSRRSSAGRHAAAYAKGDRDDRRPARARGRGRRRPRARRARGRRATRARARTGSRTPTTRTSCATSRAAHRQLEAIRASSDLDALPAELREIAELRVGTRPCRCASSPRSAGRRSPRPPPTTGCSARPPRGTLIAAARLQLVTRLPTTECVHTRARRGGARPATDSDPVRRHRSRASVNRRRRSSSESAAGRAWSAPRSSISRCRRTPEAPHVPRTPASRRTRRPLGRVRYVARS